MNVQFRSILFALVLPAAACGGGHETPKDNAPTTQSSPVKSVTSSDAGFGKPNETQKPVVVAPLPSKYDDALAQGREMVGKGDYGKAKVLLELAIKLDKKQAEPHIEMARMYIAINEKGLAIASAKKAIKLAPMSSQAWNTKGRAELNAHDYDSAIEAFSKACELNADNTYAWNNLGYTELLLAKYEDAAEHLMEATGKKGATGFMFNNLGTALEHLDRLDEARSAYEAGGKLGSKEAVASRKRLEGVTTIAIAKVDDVKDKVKQQPKGKEYDLTDEGDVPDEDTTTKVDAVDVDEPDAKTDALDAPNVSGVDDDMPND